MDSEESVRDNILEIKKAYSDKLGVKLIPLDDYDPSNECDFEIIVGSTKREECVTLTNSLEDGEYAIKAVSDNGRQKIVIAYKGNYARMYAIKTFIDNYIGEDYSMVPENLDLKGRCDDWKSVIVSKIPQLRAPLHPGRKRRLLCLRNRMGLLQKHVRLSRRRLVGTL